MADLKANLSEVQRWLLESGRPYLSEQARKQRIGLSQIQQALLEQQIEWRRRGRFRFPQSDLWLWSDKSLAQASDWLSAVYKASLFPQSLPVVDACCGAGVDSVALSLRGPVVAVDEDPWMAALAQNNATAHGTAIEAHDERLTYESLRGIQWLHADPDRRPGQSRTLEADEFSPPIFELVDLLTKVQGGLLKVAPATRFDANTSQWIDKHCARVWVGSYGECRQQLLLYGGTRQAQWLPSQMMTELEKPAARMAVVLGPLESNADPSSQNSHQFPHQFRGMDARLAFAYDCFASAEADRFHASIEEEQVGQYVYDLHAVLHAAELHEVWAERNELTAITDPRGYFTSDHHLLGPLAQCFEVIEVISWDDRKLRKWLRANSVGQVEVKCRLHTLDASALQRRYSNKEGQSIALLVTRFGDRIRAIACRRCLK